MIQRLSSVLGVQKQILRTSRKLKGQHADITPAIWYKLKGNNLGSSDREFVLLTRQLGYYIDQLEQVTKRRAVGWKPLFEDIVRRRDSQAPPREQGRHAARMFRESTALSQGSTGVGDVIRGHLRSLGLLVLESPLPDSQIEGCTFFVGDPPFDRPCIYANTHRTTWFRRNEILMHELCHAIFDASNQGASLDLKNEHSDLEIAEERAHAFAQEALVPKEVLRHVTVSKGIRWNQLSPEALAKVVASTHVEKKLLLHTAVDYEFITSEEFQSYLQLDIARELKQVSDRALSTTEYLHKIGVQAAKWAGKRNTTIPARSLRLPVPYIGAVLDALKNAEISRSKACELLMIDETAFEERFGEEVEIQEEC